MGRSPIREPLGTVAFGEAANLDELKIGGTLLVELAHPVCMLRLAFDLAIGRSVGVPEVAAVPLYVCKVENDKVLVAVEHQLNDADPS